MFVDASSCDIAPALQNSLFDHKAILINFNTTKKKTLGNTTISKDIVNDSELELVVKLAAAECYAVHNNIDEWAPGNRENLLLGIGLNRTALRQLGPSSRYLPMEDIDFDRMRIREESIDNVKTFVDNIDFNELENMSRTCDHAVFMEVLLNAVKNDAISYQSFVHKAKGENLKNLTETPAQEKSFPVQCADTIAKLETKLNNYIDNELSREIEFYSLFEHVNMEKMTPHFLKLAKNTQPDNKLTDINYDDNSEFTSETERREYIVQYYENLYKLPETQKNNIEGCIEEFLGPEILASPMVGSMKINGALAANLNADISIEELDNAVGDTRTRTAAGPDGISNHFIKKFWRILRTPLHKYTNFCINQDSLSQSFLTAVIKLIPKKGDCTKIKNWRPISLLNCIYKIISKSINNRLKKIIDTATSRAQKGFTQSRYIQEVLINVCHNISHCNTTNMPAFVLSLDQRKAFDSVQHDFMMEAYKFFGIGNKFAKMLNLITAGRNATIRFDDGSVSRQFPLETGAPQGNSPSPLQYNLCEQIAIIKIELDPRIASVYNHFLIPPLLPALAELREPGEAGRQIPDPLFQQRPVPVLVLNAPAVIPNRNLQDPFRYESNRETDKVESFADDKTVTFLANELGLQTVVNILEQFYNISGLKCNMEKSCIMYIGSDDPAPDFLAQFDFEPVDSIKILGMNINNKVDNLQDCHTSTVEKVTKIINFWSRFYLSLPGRINIAKTLILSQISYLGCIITPKPETLKNLKTQINNFIIGRLNIAKDRVCRPTELGGLGMIDLDEFITAQQISWFKRAHTSTRDNWRVDLKRIGHGNVLIIGKIDILAERFPIFIFLCESLEKFLKFFYSTNENFSKSFLLNNPLINISIHDNRLLNWEFLARTFQAQDLSRLCRVGLDSISSNGRLLSLDEISANTGLNLNLMSYLRLQTAFHTTRKQWGGNRYSDGSAITIENFLTRFRKGSRPIRNILSGKKNSSIKVADIRNIKTLTELINATPTGDKEIKKILSFWGLSFLPMNLREFSFKFFNNSLGLNQRIAHFVGGQGQGCTFCTIVNNGPILPESFIHFFFDCETTSRIREWFQQTFIPEIVFTSRNAELKFWFYGIIPNQGENSNCFILTLVQCFFYSLWRFKLQKRCPVRSSFQLEIFYTLEKIVLASNLIREHMTFVDLYLCRNWDTIRHRRG